MRLFFIIAILILIPFHTYAASNLNAARNYSASDDGNHTINICATKNNTLCVPFTLTISSSAAGVCGSANGVATSSAPTTNLCSSGTASSVTGTGPWSWTCAGSGTPTQCSAPVSGGGSVPAPAQNAGFNTLAMSANFTDSFYATQSNWLNCHNRDGSDGVPGGSAGPGPRTLYRAWEGFGEAFSPPCSAQSQQTDPIDGQKSMQLHWDDSWYGLGTVNYADLDTTDNNETVNMFPPNAYFEVVGRYDVPKDWTTMDFWSHTGTCCIEFDGVEAWFPPNYGGDASSVVQGDGGGFWFGAWTGNPPSFGSSFDWTAYHIYAWRTTSSGPGGQSYFCAYIDNIPQGSCQRWDQGVAIRLSGQNTSLLMQGGAYCRDAAPCAPGGTNNVWVRSFRVYSCAGAGSGAKCYTGNPNP